MAAAPPPPLSTASSTPTVPLQRLVRLAVDALYDGLADLQRDLAVLPSSTDDASYLTPAAGSAATTASAHDAAVRAAAATRAARLLAWVNGAISMVAQLTSVTAAALPPTPSTESVSRGVAAARRALAAFDDTDSRFAGALVAVGGVARLITATAKPRFAVDDALSVLQTGALPAHAAPLPLYRTARRPLACTRDVLTAVPRVRAAIDDALADTAAAADDDDSTLAVAAARLSVHPPAVPAPAKSSLLRLPAAATAAPAVATARAAEAALLVATSRARLDDDGCLVITAASGLSCRMMALRSGPPPTRDAPPPPPPGWGIVDVAWRTAGDAATRDELTAGQRNALIARLQLIALEAGTSADVVARMRTAMDALSNTLTVPRLVSELAGRARLPPAVAGATVAAAAGSHGAHLRVTHTVVPPWSGGGVGVVAVNASYILPVEPPVAMVAAGTARASAALPAAPPTLPPALAAWSTDVGDRLDAACSSLRVAAGAAALAPRRAHVRLWTGASATGGAGEPNGARLPRLDLWGCTALPEPGHHSDVNALLEGALAASLHVLASAYGAPLLAGVGVGTTPAATAAPLPLPPFAIATTGCRDALLDGASGTGRPFPAVDRPDTYVVDESGCAAPLPRAAGAVLPMHTHAALHGYHPSAPAAGALAADAAAVAASRGVPGSSGGRGDDYAPAATWATGEVRIQPGGGAAAGAYWAQRGGGGGGGGGGVGSATGGGRSLRTSGVSIGGAVASRAADEGYSTSDGGAAALAAARTLWAALCASREVATTAATSEHEAARQAIARRALARVVPSLVTILRDVAAGDGRLSVSVDALLRHGGGVPTDCVRLTSAFPRPPPATSGDALVEAITPHVYRAVVSLNGPGGAAAAAARPQYQVFQPYIAAAADATMAGLRAADEARGARQGPAAQGTLLLLAQLTAQPLSTYLAAHLAAFLSFAHNVHAAMASPLTAPLAAAAAYRAAVLISLRLLLLASAPAGATRLSDALARLSASTFRTFLRAAAAAFAARCPAGAPPSASGAAAVAPSPSEAVAHILSAGVAGGLLQSGAYRDSDAIPTSPSLWAPGAPLPLAAVEVGRADAGGHARAEFWATCRRLVRGEWGAGGLDAGAAPPGGAADATKASNTATQPPAAADTPPLCALRLLPACEAPGTRRDGWQTIRDGAVDTPAVVSVLAGAGAQVAAVVGRAAQHIMAARADLAAVAATCTGSPSVDAQGVLHLPVVAGGGAAGDDTTTHLAVWVEPATGALCMRLERPAHASTMYEHTPLEAVVADGVAAGRAQLATRLEALGGTIAAADAALSARVTVALATQARRAGASTSTPASTSASAPTPAGAAAAAAAPLQVSLRAALLRPLEATSCLALLTSAPSVAQASEGSTNGPAAIAAAVNLTAALAEWAQASAPTAGVDATAGATESADGGLRVDTPASVDERACLTADDTAAVLARYARALRRSGMGGAAGVAAAAAAASVGVGAGAGTAAPPGLLARLRSSLESGGSGGGGGGGGAGGAVLEIPPILAPLVASQHNLFFAATSLVLAHHAELLSLAAAPSTTPLAAVAAAADALEASAIDAGAAAGVVGRLAGGGRWDGARSAVGAAAAAAQRRRRCACGVAARACHCHRLASAVRHVV